MKKPKIIEINRTKEFNEKHPPKAIPRTKEQIDRDFEFYYETKKDVLSKSANIGLDQKPLTQTINDFYLNKNYSSHTNLTKYTSYSRYFQKISF